MTFLFILCLIFSFVLLWLSSYSTNDTLQLIFFISAGLLMFIGGFGLLRLRRRASYEKAEADRRFSDLNSRHSENAERYQKPQAYLPQKTEKLVPIFGIAVLLSTVVYSIAVPSSLAPVQDVSSYAVSRITSNADSAGLTLSQYNAVRSARSYLNYSSFSRSGLIKQLEFEKYSTADAEFAVDYLSPDWYEEAAEAAASYLRYSSFSADGLVDQLMFEGFTRDQANYGVKQVGY